MHLHILRVGSRGPPGPAGGWGRRGACAAQSQVPELQGPGSPPPPLLQVPPYRSEGLPTSPLVLGVLRPYPAALRKVCDPQGSRRHPNGPSPSSPPPGAPKWPPLLQVPTSLPLASPPRQAPTPSRGRRVGASRVHANIVVSVSSPCLRLAHPGVTPCSPFPWVSHGPTPHRPSTILLCPQPEESKAHEEGARPPPASAPSTGAAGHLQESRRSGPGGQSLLHGSPSMSGARAQLESQVPEAGEAQQLSWSSASAVPQALVHGDGGCGLCGRPLCSTPRGRAGAEAPDRAGGSVGSQAKTPPCLAWR